MFSEKSWILYTVKRRPNGKLDKIPISPHTLRMVDVTDITHHETYEVCRSVMSKNSTKVWGLAFCVCPGYFFLDVDGCVQHGQWNSLARQMLNDFEGAYVETSVSGEGLHIIGRTTYIAEGVKCKSPHGFELYMRSRFVAFTGTDARGDPTLNCDEPLGKLIETYQLRKDPIEEVFNSGESFLSDDEVISRIQTSVSARSVFGIAASASQLWAGEGLGEIFPSERDDYDHSRADAALLAHLAFWCNRDAEQMERVFERSALVRDKWRDRPDYRHRSITFAISNCSETYSVKKPESSEKTFSNFISAADTEEFFRGCTYVTEKHKILTPKGLLLSPDQFSAAFGGRLFSLDETGSKTTKKAWDAFVFSSHYSAARADSCCFRPELKPLGLLQEEGLTKVNTYVPIDTGSVSGDVEPFLRHMSLLFPIHRDRQIVLAYMAALVQKKGCKFGWMVVVQGTYGNGKSFLIDCLGHAVGWRYTHLARAKDMAGRFNSWIENKMFVGIHELFASVEVRKEVAETLKEMLGSTRIESEGKGVNQEVIDNRANLFGCSNFKEAVPKTSDDRRFSVFITPQQSKQDLESSGMGGLYFPKLMGWANAGGWQKVSYYLENYAIPHELDPSGSCHRAPATSSESDAIEMSFGLVEQEILEAVREGIPGFRKGWISSIALQRFLEVKRLENRVSRNKRPSLLASLGYTPHPSLPAGRCTSTSITDGGKPVLYVSAGHEGIAVTKGKDIVALYDSHQIEPIGALRAVK